MDSPDATGNLLEKQGPHSGQTLYAMSGSLPEIIPRVSINLVYILCKKPLFTTMYVIADHVCNITGNTNYTFHTERVVQLEIWGNIQVMKAINATFTNCIRFHLFFGQVILCQTNTSAYMYVTFDRIMPV